MAGPRRPSTPPSAWPSTPPPPRRSRSARAPRPIGELIGAALALLIVGAFVGVGIASLGSKPAADASSAPSAAPTDDTGAAPTDNPDSSGNPDGSIAPVSPVLEALMPQTVSGSTMTIQSAVDATSLSGGPDGRALNAAVVHMGKATSDLEIAVAFDDSGAIDLTILGFRVDGIAAATTRAAVLSAWLASGIPGVTTTTLSWSGTSVTKVSYGDDGGDEYVISVHDSVFVLETVDEAVAQAAVTAIVAQAQAAGSPPAPPAPSGS